MKDTIDNLSIMKPFSFILEDDEKNNIAELYLSHQSDKYNTVSYDQLYLHL